MGLIDAFDREDRTEMKFSTFYALMEGNAKTKFLMNAVNCNVPYRYIREMATGVSEEVSTESGRNGREEREEGETTE